MLASLVALSLASTLSTLPVDAPRRETDVGLLASVPRAASFLDVGSGGDGGKSINPLLVTGEMVLGTAAGYLGLVAGLALNLPHGGLSVPADGADILYLFVLPSAAAAVTSWVIGLFDLKQRNFVFSLLHSLVGAAIGEAIGIGVGFLLAALFPGPGLPALLWGAGAGPLLAAVGATVAMEALKSGAEAQNPASSASLHRLQDGTPRVAPLAALAF